MNEKFEYWKVAFKLSYAEMLSWFKSNNREITNIRDLYDFFDSHDIFCCLNRNSIKRGFHNSDIIYHFDSGITKQSGIRHKNPSDRTSCEIEMFDAAFSVLNDRIMCQKFDKDKIYLFLFGISKSDGKISYVRSDRYGHRLSDNCDSYSADFSRFMLCKDTSELVGVVYDVANIEPHIFNNDQDLQSFLQSYR